MKTTADFLDALKAKFNTDSDAAACREIGVNHRQQVSRWRQMHGTFDDELCLKIADVLDIDPAYIVACMHFQRTKQSEVKRVWERIASMTAGASAAVLLSLFIPSQDVDFNQFSLIAATTQFFNNPLNVYYVKSLTFYCLSLIPLFILMVTAFRLHTVRKK